MDGENKIEAHPFRKVESRDCSLDLDRFDPFRGSHPLFRSRGSDTRFRSFRCFWYNWIYTPLKQKTAFAAVPGALVGAIPPALGWVAGGGTLLDPRIGGLALFFFIWQIPHFWLLLLDSSRDYESAGLPSITKIFSTEQIKRIVFIWLLSTGVSSLIIPLFGLLSSFFSCVLSVAATSWFFWNTIIFIRSFDDRDSLRATFIKLNFYAVLVLLLLSVDRLLSS